MGTPFLSLFFCFVFFSFFLQLSFIEVYLIYNVVIISAIRRSDEVIHVHKRCLLLTLGKEVMLVRDSLSFRVW